MNSGLPTGKADGPSAPNVAADAALAQAADTTFLALVLWREARGESHEAKAAVACSIINRVDRPSWWGRSVLEVLFKRWQYSSVTAPTDRQLATWPAPADPIWWECMRIARDVLAGAVANPVPGADSYYDISIPAPRWADPAKFVGQVGRFQFYDLDSDHELAGRGMSRCAGKTTPPTVPKETST